MRVLAAWSSSTPDAGNISAGSSVILSARNFRHASDLTVAAFVVVALKDAHAGLGRLVFFDAGCREHQRRFFSHPLGAELSTRFRSDSGGICSRRAQRRACGSWPPGLLRRRMQGTSAPVLQSSSRRGTFDTLPI